MAWNAHGKRHIHKSIVPIWQDDLAGFGQSNFLMVHARSAFRDEGIEIQNNMPFYDKDYVFIFNGEVRGVRIREKGRIGAEKIFNFIKRFNKDDIYPAFRKGLSVIRKKSRYVRAMNIMLSDMEKVYFCNIYNEDTDYFAMHRIQKDGLYILCSRPYHGESGWEKLKNNSIGICE